MAEIILDFPKIINTVTGLVRISGLTSEYEILSNSERHIEQTGSDNWNGGTDIYSIYLSTSIELYSRYESRLKEIEETILSKIRPFLRKYPNVGISEVVISPRLAESSFSPETLYKTKEGYAFISYKTKSGDEHVAAKIKKILEGINIDSFLAHEDISVSIEWQNKILEEIAKASIFICLLSKSYLDSYWCLQESGVAAFRNISIIPLSLDGTTPPGFIAKYQSTKIDRECPRLHDLIPGILNYNKLKGLNIIIELIGASGNFRGAEENFKLILPYVDDLTEIQMKELLKKIRENNQVHHASLCASEYIPQLLGKYGDLLPKKDFEFLKETCKQYNTII